MNDYEDELPHFRTALICRKGHVVTSDLEGSLGEKQSFCKRCGAENISACPRCQEPIHGYHHIPGETDLTPYVPPKYCHNCGRPYPWTETGLDGLRELVRETANLSTEEKESLSRSLDDLIADTPKTAVAIVRIKRWLAGAGKEVGPIARKILVETATEAVKRELGLS